MTGRQVTAAVVSNSDTLESSVTLEMMGFGRIETDCTMKGTEASSQVAEQHVDVHQHCNLFPSDPQTSKHSDSSQ